MNNVFKTAVAALLLILMPVSAYSLSTDKDQPMDIEADRVDIDDSTGLNTFRGNVVVTQGTIRLNADVVTVYKKKNDVSRVVAKGHPAVYRQRPEKKQEDVVAEANQIEYLAIQGKILLINKAKITQGKDTFTGNRIEYDIKKDLVLARKSPEGGSRVRITIQPKSKKPADNKTPGKAP
jgi:lipopolysaccharide export system protein LptA